ncbi:MAG: peptide ABC transporter substrate-binding protein [Candidatus Aquicultor sp.]
MLFANGCDGIKLGGIKLFASDQKSSPKKPQRGGRLTIGCAQEPTSLNPFLTGGSTAATKLVTSNILWGLLVVTPDLSYAPRIAEKVPTVENGLVTKSPFTVTYDIKKDAVWSDGTPITAEDIKFTWETIMNPAYQIADRSGYDKIERIDTPYDKTLRIVFKEPYAAYKQLFSTTYPILPKHILERQGFNEAINELLPFASGPYKFKDWVRADHLTIVRNDGFWGDNAYIDKVTFKFIPKDDGQVTGLSEGKIDVLYPSDTKAVTDRIKSIAGTAGFAEPGLVWEHLAFNTSKPPLNDINVRKAIAYALDRKKIAEAATGEPSVLESILVPDQKPFYTPAWKKYALQPEKAAQYLSRAGYKKGPDGIFQKNGKKLVVKISTASGNPTRKEVEKTIQDNLNSVGIKVETQNADGETFFNSRLAKGDFELGIWAWLEDTEPNLGYMFCADATPPAGGNYYRYSNPEVTAALKIIPSVIDDTKRAGLYRNVQQKISDDCVVIPLYQHIQVLAFNKKVNGIKDNTSFEGPFWNLSRWWISKEQR